MPSRGSMPLTYHPTPHMGHHATTHNNPAAPQLTRTDTCTTSIHCASRHTSPRPHMSPTCHHTPTRMLTPLTWPAARGTFRYPSHYLSIPWGAARSPGEGATTLPRPAEDSFSRGSPTQPTQTSLNTHLLPGFKRSPRGRDYSMRLRTISGGGVARQSQAQM